MLGEKGNNGIIRINTIGEYLKERFGCKVVKLSIEGGFTCPNRDGRAGTGGCLFCSAAGSGDMASTIPKQIELLYDKWPEAKYIAYFQSHTNTYAPLGELKEKYESALCYDKERIVGLAIATRPDCLSDEVLEYLSELNKRTFLWVELGLQTKHEKTAKLINRCYELDVYEKAVSELRSRNIKVVTHLIFGLPGETKEEMLESVKYVAGDGIFGMKMHLLNVVKGSPMEKVFPDYVPFSGMDEYVDLVVSALRIIPKDVTIHRMTGDTKRSLLIAPKWSYEKRTILNKITNKMNALDAFQGDKALYFETDL